MSLINDALKRANQSQNAPPPPSANPAREAVMQPVVSRPGSSNPTVLILVVLLFLVLSGASWIFWQWSKSPKPGNTVAASNPVSIPASAPAIQTPAPVQTPAQATVATPVLASPPVTAAPDSASPAAFPKLKLQGIFYNKTSPAAMLNGRRVSVGGTISGARVVKIEPESVTVEWKGESQIFELPQ